MQGQTKNTNWGRLKQVITVTLLFMMVGTLLELYLLEHYEGVWQFIPLICIGASLLTMVSLLFFSTTVLIFLYQILLGATALSGFVGIFFHLRANFEFEQEMKPTAENWDLLVESFSGALPALAPASMVVLALIGYSYLLLIKQKK
jgi:hypothetical protein